MALKPDSPSESLREGNRKGRIQWIDERIRRVWEPISAVIPGTKAFEKGHKEKVADTRNLYTKYIEELSALSPEAKQRSSKNILYHVDRLSAIDTIREIYPTWRIVDATVPVLALGLVSSVFATLIWLRADYPLWGVILIVCLCPILFSVSLLIILLLAAVITEPIRWFVKGSGTLALMYLSGMTLAGLIFWQGYLQSRNALGVLGYPLSEATANLIIGAVGGIYLILVFYSIAKEVRREKWFKSLFSGLLEPDTMLVFLAGIALVCFPLYRPHFMANVSSVSVLNSAVVAGLFGALVFWVVLATLAIGLAVLGFAIGLYKLRRCPDSVLVHKLFWILMAVEKYPDEWQDLKFKQVNFLEGLETAAVALARIPRGLHCGDARTDTWLVEEFQKKAAFLRYMKTWVLTPMADTRDVFMNCIARDLTYAADGTWDALAKVQDEKVLASYLRPRDSGNWRSLVSGLLRRVYDLATGLVPLGGILALQQTAFAIEKSVADYLTVGATIWAVVRVLLTIDPQFVQTLNTIKLIGEASKKTS